MRIACPYCGQRDAGEFAYLGDASASRPPLSEPDSEVDIRAHYEALYLRTNPRGPHIELWYHAAGCRSWLRVQRDTLSHTVQAVALADGTRAEPRS